LDHHFRGNIRFVRSDGPGKQRRWLPWIDDNDPEEHLWSATGYLTSPAEAVPVGVGG
jgi:hypothetical protein